MDIQDLTQLPKTRQEAIHLGSKYYFTGKVCPKGHLDKKLTSDCGCNSCKKNAVKLWAKNNPEVKKKKARESALRHWDKCLARHKEWQNKNREKVRAENRNYYLKNKEKCRNMVLNWVKNNPEAVRAILLNRLSRKRNADGSFSKKDILEKLNLQNNKCVYCQCDVSKIYHVDHITPLYRGGSNWAENLQILCPSCNCSKGAKTHDEFIKFLHKQKSV